MGWPLSPPTLRSLSTVLLRIATHSLFWIEKRERLTVTQPLRRLGPSA